MTGDAGALQETARRLLGEIGCSQLAGQVQVRWGRGMRSTAGSARYERALITLNPRLLEFGLAEIDRTLRHEIAHLAAKFRAGRRRIAPHGAEWKQACRDLGLANEPRCHDLPLPRKRLPAKHAYRCPECHVEILRVRPFRRKVACLSCCRRFNGGRYHEKFRIVKAAGLAARATAGQK